MTEFDLKGRTAAELFLEEVDAILHGSNFQPQTQGNLKMLMEAVVAYVEQREKK